MNSRLFRTLPLSLAGLLLVGGAAAVTPMSSSLPTSACLTAGGTVVHDWLGFLNKSTTAVMNVDCGDTWSVPNVGVPDGGGTMTVSLNVYDRSSTANVKCAMKTIGTSGSINFSSGFEQSSGVTSGDTPQTLTWEVGELGNTLVACEVPRATANGYSGIGNFWVVHY